MQPELKQVAFLSEGGFRNVAYAEWGSPDAERTVICVHGVSRSGRDFDVLAQALVDNGARVIAPDLPGRGRSEWLPSPAHYTDRAYMNAMAAVITRLDVAEVDWIGTSLGGHIGMLLAAEGGTPVRRLVLNDFGARIAAGALRRIGGYLMRSWRFDTLESLESHLREALAPFGNLTDEQWRHMAVTSATADGKGGFRFHFDPAIGMRFSIPIWVDVVLWQLWDRIECPVLVLRGEDSDLLSRDTVEQMTRRGAAARAGKVTAIEVEGCGHAPALLDAAQVKTITDFLFPPEAPARQAQADGRGRSPRLSKASAAR